jgi:cytochrome b
MNKLKMVSVWDPVIRIGHWTLVIAFFTAYFTEDNLMTLHAWAGYVIAAVITVRLIWGFIGGHYAKFSQFLYKPTVVFNYLNNLIRGKPQHYIGHNPAGGAMVIALLLSLILTVVSGMKLYAVEENAGPLAVAAQWKTADANTPSTTNNLSIAHKVSEVDEKRWEEIHETFVNITLLLVFLHIGGIMISSIVDKEKLVKAMWTGKKEVGDHHH